MIAQNLNKPNCCDKWESKLNNDINWSTCFSSMLDCFKRWQSDHTCHHPHRFSEIATKNYLKKKKKWNGKPRLDYVNCRHSPPKSSGSGLTSDRSQLGALAATFSYLCFADFWWTFSSYSVVLVVTVIVSTRLVVLLSLIHI